MIGYRAITFVGLLAAGSHAHFTLDYPATRGFDEDIENRFCGGFSTPGNRSIFPLSNGVIQITSTHESASFVTLISFNPDPKNFTVFNTTSSGATIPYLKPFLKLSAAGKYCYPVDIQALGIEGVGEGTNATIQIQYDGGDGNLYQCTDITLSSSATTAGATCSNTTSLAGEQIVSSTSSAAPSSSTTPASSAGSLNYQFGAAFAISAVGIVAAALL